MYRSVRSSRESGVREVGNKGTKSGQWNLQYVLKGCFHLRKNQCPLSGANDVSLSHSNSPREWSAKHHLHRLLMLCPWPITHLEWKVDPRRRPTYT